MLLALVAGCLLALNACGESKKESEPVKAASKTSDGDKKSKKGDDKKPEAEKRTKKKASKGRTGKRKTAIKSIEERRKERAKSLAERRAKLKKRREARRKERAGNPAQRRRPTSASRSRPAPTASMGPRVGLEPTPRRAAPTMSYLRIDHFITLSDARALTDTKRLSQIGPLVGVKPTDRYNSIYFAPPKRSRFGVAIQVWKERTIGGVNERFTRMKRDYPNVDKSREVSKGSDREFFSNWENIMSVTFAAMKKRTIITVSCGTKTCNLKQLYALARAAYGRL